MWKTLWQLAKFEGSGSYKELFDAYNVFSDFGAHIAPLSFLRGGRYTYNNGNPETAGNHGYYWESKASSDALARFLHFHSAWFGPQGSGNGYNKGYGAPIRCVVR